jgi:hypothetical protein
LLEKYLPSKISISSLLRLKCIFKTTYSILCRRLVHDGFWDAYIFLTKKFTKNTLSTKVLLPERKNCFKSKKTFRTFNIKSYWKNIEKLLSNNIDEDFLETTLRVCKKNYRFEAKFLNNSIIGMLVLENR